MPAIALQILPHVTASGIAYQHLHIHLTTVDALVEPQDLQDIHLPESIIWSQGIVLEGKAPIWVYGYLIHTCHPAAWVGCFDPRLGDPVPGSGGAVIVAAHTREVEVGKVLKVKLPQTLSQQD